VCEHTAESLGTQQPVFRLAPSRPEARSTSTRHTSITSEPADASGYPRKSGVSRGLDTSLVKASGQVGQNYQRALARYRHPGVTGRAIFLKEAI